jgi:hypothetical protein
VLRSVEAVAALVLEEEGVVVVGQQDVEEEDVEPLVEEEVQKQRSPFLFDDLSIRTEGRRHLVYLCAVRRV